MKDNQKILNLLAELTGQFLLEHGGSANGYDTYIAGTITPNKIGGISQFNTPDTYHMTINRVRKLCDDFEVEVKKLINLYDFDSIITFSYEYRDHGCYFQTITISDSINVSYHTVKK